MDSATRPAPATADLSESLSRFEVLRVQLRIIPAEPLKLPADNKGNTIRGAFGTAFRRLACLPQCPSAQQCPLDGARYDGAPVCPYRAVFEPPPPVEAGRLSGNQDAPRPFVFEPPPDPRTAYEAGEAFEFGLTLLGRGVGYLAYFILAFREVAAAGFGLNRARCLLERVETAPWDDGVPEVVYSSRDQVMHSPRKMALGNYLSHRVDALGGADAIRQASRVRMSFLTPTCLKHEGEVVRQPQFHQIFKRARDRINALAIPLWQAWRPALGQWQPARR